MGLARTDHDRRALLRQHEDRDTPLWLLSPTHTTNGTSQPKKQLRPESERPQQPPPCACGRRAVRAAVCGVWRSSAHTNTQLAPPRWLCGQCPSSARRWGCMPVDVAVWAMAPLRGGTAPTRRGRATGKKDQPMTKNSELGCPADTVPITGCNAWVLAIAQRPSSRQSTDTGGFGPMRSCRSARASLRLHSSN